MYVFNACSRFVERGRNRTFNLLMKSRLELGTRFQTNSLSNQTFAGTKPARKHFDEVAKSSLKRISVQSVWCVYGTGKNCDLSKRAAKKLSAPKCKNCVMDECPPAL